MNFAAFQTTEVKHKCPRIHRYDFIVTTGIGRNVRDGNIICHCVSVCRRLEFSSRKTKKENKVNMKPHQLFLFPQKSGRKQIKRPPLKASRAPVSRETIRCRSVVQNSSAWAAAQSQLPQNVPSSETTCSSIFKNKQTKSNNLQK